MPAALILFVLVSANDMLAENEEMMILGQVGWSGAEDRMNFLGKPRPRHSWFDPGLHFLAQGVLGGWSRSGTGRTLCSDPRRCFCICGNLQQGPLRSRTEIVRLLIVFLAAGLRIAVFATAALAMLVQEFSTRLSLWLSAPG